jgi:DNA-directed RNA polymerase specialized sigma24 family protein
VLREIDRELEHVESELSRYDELVHERERLLAARAALTGQAPPGARARRRISQDDVAAFLSEHPGASPSEMASALGVPVTNVSAHLYRGKSTRFERGGHGWRLRSE